MVGSKLDEDERDSAYAWWCCRRKQRRIKREIALMEMVCSALKEVVYCVNGDGQEVGEGMRKKQVREREEGGGGWLVERWLLRLTSSACTATALLLLF